MNISLLLGSGFSVAAGLPSKDKLNKRLLYLKNEKLRISPAGEMINNHSDNNTIWPEKQKSLDLCFAIMEDYCQRNEFDYECFYDYLTIKAIDDEKMHQRLKSVVVFSEQGAKSDIINLDVVYNQMIAHCLIPFQTYYDNLLNTKEKKESYADFKRFIECLKDHNHLYIHTLNHDLLLEQLLGRNRISDGFTMDNSPFWGMINTDRIHERIMLPYYNEAYETNKPCLYKLHGSLDYYKYNDVDGLVVIKVPKGIDNSSFQKKVNGKLIDREIGNYHPMFLTGVKTKNPKYDNNSYYKKQIIHFQDNICKSDYLVIIGYSFGDKKINELLFKFRDADNCLIINPNRNDEKMSFSKGKPKFVEKKFDKVIFSEYLELIK